MGSCKQVFFSGLCAATLLVGQIRAQAVHSPEKIQIDDTQQSYQQITVPGRLQWFTYNTIGPRSLAVGVFTAGYGTGIDSPKEYGPHWDGFGKRYGMRLSGVSTQNAMEVSLGSIWGEDPRYFRTTGQPFSNRLGHVIKMAFLAKNQSGGTMPAYARYAAIPGNNFLSNTWRANSDAHVSSALERSLVGFLARMASNALTEFFPDAKDALSRKAPSTP